MSPNKSTAPSGSQRTMLYPTIQSFPPQGKKHAQKKKKKLVLSPPLCFPYLQLKISIPDYMAISEARDTQLSSNNSPAQNSPNSLCKATHCRILIGQYNRSLHKFTLRLATILARLPWLHGEFGEFLRVLALRVPSGQHNLNDYPTHFYSSTLKDKSAEFFFPQCNHRRKKKSPHLK